MKKLVAALIIVLFSFTLNAQDTKTTKESCSAKTMTASEVSKCQAKCKADGKVCTAKEAAKCDSKAKKCCAKKA